MQISALKVGVDVPWVTSWTAETVTGVAPCASVGGRLALGQEQRPGYGKPEYSRNHLLRQRLTVRRMLCPMCGQPTAEGDRVTQLARRVPVGVLRKEGLRAAVPDRLEDDLIVLEAGSIAPLHRACSERSLRYCPHLKASRNVEVMDFSPAWTLMPLMIAALPQAASANVLARRPPPARPTPVVTFIQLLGLTTDRDPRWRRNAAAYARAA